MLEQLQSPLFKLPPELRDVIWSFACSASIDTSRPYEANSNYCRPGFTHATVVSTAMLQTCRKAYLECHHLPLSVNTQVFWCYRGPKGEPSTGNRREQLGKPGLLSFWIVRPA